MALFGERVTANPALQPRAEAQNDVPGVAAPPDATKTKHGITWNVLVVGLVAMLLISLGGILYAVLDKSADTVPGVIVTLFTTTLAAVVGLFAKAP